LEVIFKLHGQICSEVEAVVLALYKIFPIIDQLHNKISEGDYQDYRLDRRLRVSSLIQTVVAAHSHLSKAVRSARLTAIIQKEELDNFRPEIFE
jgi:hypothetical protein